MANIASLASESGMFEFVTASENLPFVLLFAFSKYLKHIKRLKSFAQNFSMGDPYTVNVYSSMHLYVHICIKCIFR